MNVGTKLIISSAAFVATIASACAQGAECVVEVDGGLSLTRPAVHFKPVVHAFNWRSMSAGVPTSDKPAGTFAIRIAEGQTLWGSVEAQSADDGAVQVRYAFESEAEIDVDSISIAADLASSSICGSVRCSPQRSASGAQSRSSCTAAVSASCSGARAWRCC